MNQLIPSALAVASHVYSFAFVQLAQVKWATAEDFKLGIGKIAGLIVMVSWLIALGVYYYGTTQRENNPAAAKGAFITTGLVAAGGPIVGLLFYMFVGESGTPTPSF